MCNFEYALLGYLKGNRLVPDWECFKLGHIKCKKTINNSLTPDTFRISGLEGELLVAFLNTFNMKTLYAKADISRKIKKTKDFSIHFIEKNQSRSLKYGIKDQKLDPFLSKKPTNKANSKIQSTRLKKDYEFLKNLEQSLEKIDEDKFQDTATEMNIESDQGEVVLDLVRDSIVFLDHRAEFWTNMK